jgi:hypothetical protein
MALPTGKRAAYQRCHLPPSSCSIAGQREGCSPVPPRSPAWVHPIQAWTWRPSLRPSWNARHRLDAEDGGGGGRLAMVSSGRMRTRKARWSGEWWPRREVKRRRRFLRNPSASTPWDGLDKCKRGEMRYGTQRIRGPPLAHKPAVSCVVTALSAQAHDQA